LILLKLPQIFIFVFLKKKIQIDEQSLKISLDLPNIFQGFNGFIVVAAIVFL
jgi:hypothetical protein